MRILLAVLAAALLWPGASAADERTTYDVSTTLSHLGQEFAAPSAVVRAGRTASVEGDGADPFKLTLRVTDIAADQIRVEASLNSSHGSMYPVVIVRPGEPATVSIGNLAMELTVNRSGG